MKLFKVIETSFENFDKNVRDYLSKMFGSFGLQYTHNQIFGIVYDGIKGILQNVMFYIEDAMTELNILTAIRKKSIVSLAKLSGFNAYYGSSATGTISLRLALNNGLLQEDISNKLYIKNHTTIINTATGFKYIMEIPLDYYIIDVTQGILNYEFKIVQGYYATGQYTAMGYALEKMSISNLSMFDLNYIEVYVDGELWERVANLYEMTENSKTYVLETGYESSFDIMFGNDIYGKKLIKGQNVFVKFLVHDGQLANIHQNTKVNFEFYDSGTDSEGNNIDLNQYLKIYNNTLITGGTDADSIEVIRDMIGYNSRSLVLANEDNFKLFLKRFSFVGNMNIWSERNSMTISANITQNLSHIDNVDYFDIQPSDILLTNEHKNIIKTVLNKSNKTFAGVSFNFIDPIIRKYAMVCYLKCESGYNKDLIKNYIKDSVANYLKNLEINTTFISKTDIIKKVTSEVDGLTYFDFSFISELAEECFYNGYYDNYELEYVNGTYNYIKKKVYYESNVEPGLDKFGNIQLNSKLEIPLVCGGFNYFSDKKDKNQSIKLDGMNMIFI